MKLRCHGIALFLFVFFLGSCSVNQYVFPPQQTDESLKTSSLSGVDIYIKVVDQSYFNPYTQQMESEILSLVAKTFPNSTVQKGFKNSSGSIELKFIVHSYSTTYRDDHLYGVTAIDLEIADSRSGEMLKELKTFKNEDDTNDWFGNSTSKSLLMDTFHSVSLDINRYLAENFG